MSNDHNPYQPPDAPPRESTPRRTWLGGLLGVACLLGGSVGVVCVAVGAAAVARLSASPGGLLGDPRGRVLLLIEGGIALGGVRLFVAARTCFRGEWRAAGADVLLGAGLLGGSLWYVVSQALR